MSVDPKALSIVHYPAEVLRQKAKEVPDVTADVRRVAERMIELMFEAEGIGLAAPQVGLPWRMFVAHVPENEDRSLGADPMEATGEPMVCINPQLSLPERDLVPFEEGCLSLPEIVGEVRRPSRITMTALGIDGREFTVRASGLLARCWQHENDHLDGVLIIDRMTPPSRLRNRNALKALEQRAVFH
ncbi:MAG: peptide deformylase [Phycisphaerales bacterium]|nr:peptide deformylase [Phycisphaerales bacterium]